jgi:hypothetical protein
LHFNQKSTGSSFDLNALNKLDAQEVLNEYLLAHKTGEKELLTLRLLDDFYDKSDEYLSTHSDVYNIKSVDVKSIEEINVSGEEMEQIKLTSEERHFASGVQIEDVKKFVAEYTLIPIDEQKGFLTDESYNRKEEYTLIKRFGIWKIFDHGNA